MRGIAVGSVKRRLGFRSFGQLNIMVALQDVECAEVLRSAEGIQCVVYARQHITIWVESLHV